MDNRRISSKHLFHWSPSPIPSPPMAKPRKPKSSDDSKSDNFGAVVRHQKLCLSIDLPRSRIYGFLSLSLSSLLSLSPLPFHHCHFHVSKTTPRFASCQVHRAGDRGPWNRDCRVTRREFGDRERVCGRRAHGLRVLPLRLSRRRGPMGIRRRAGLRRRRRRLRLRLRPPQGVRSESAHQLLQSFQAGTRKPFGPNALGPTIVCPSQAGSFFSIEGFSNPNAAKLLVSGFRFQVVDVVLCRMWGWFGLTIGWRRRRLGFTLMATCFILITRYGALDAGSRARTSFRSVAGTKISLLKFFLFFFFG